MTPAAATLPHKLQAAMPFAALCPFCLQLPKSHHVMCLARISGTNDGIEPAYDEVLLHAFAPRDPLCNCLQSPKLLLPVDRAEVRRQPNYNRLAEHIT